MADKIRINATDIEAFIEGGEANGTMDTFIDLLSKSLDMMKDDNSPNVVLGDVILINDLPDEDEESEDDESEDETTTETPKE